jgi:NAD(P)-dependent dehydrogenase (short-subunit alcohol dehydrogenase family)
MPEAASNTFEAASESVLLRFGNEGDDTARQHSSPPAVLPVCALVDPNRFELAFGLLPGPLASAHGGAHVEDFRGRLAVVTGGGSGMGRELVVQLAAGGCHVATCDISLETLAETHRLAQTVTPPGTRITTCVADVSDEAQVIAFRDAVVADQQTDHVNLLFNNAGVGGGGSFVLDDRHEWDKTFDICWGGVYRCTRAFLPLLIAADSSRIVNTSSVNGFWASLGPNIPHTAYSAAKFAVKGFSEALITDLRLHAPHVEVSVVMPGHIGTSIVINSGVVHGRNPKDLTEEQLLPLRDRITAAGIDLGGVSDEDLRTVIIAQGEAFRDRAPMSAAQAATVILDGVRAGQWRILVGDDAHLMDRLVRETPEDAYGPAFMDRLRAAGAFGFVDLL